MSLAAKLNPEKALIFRITHRSNMEWILQNGLHCSSSPTKDPNFLSIGNRELIAKRDSRPVPVPPSGGLGDYVPFYFTPFSPMLLNIITGYGDIKRRSNDEIVILISSLDELDQLGVRYVFTDRHAYLVSAEFYADRGDLDKVDFGLLQQRDFQRDPEDPGKVERYQAEALVYQHLPVAALLGVACYTEKTRQSVERSARERGIDLTILKRRGWYFT
jgi:hypothetical protein